MDINIKEIKFPSLTDSTMGENLENVFSNINNNFQILANRDFVKGDSGDSIEVRQIDFSESFNEEFTYGELLKKSIENYAINAGYDLTDVNDLSVFTVFDNPNLRGSLNLIINTSNYDEDKIVGSLYYVFLDGRFNHTNLGILSDKDKSKYQDITDLSCVLLFDSDNNNFKVLLNAFPTIYYEKELGFCWRINGAETGFPIQGIPGKDGEDALLQIVKGVVLNDNTIKVTKIFNPYIGYENITATNIDNLNNTSAIILREYETIIDDSEQRKNPNMSFYFGKLVKEDNQLIAYCDINNPVNRAFSEEDMINAMKNINLLSSYSPSTGMKGLFIPIEDYKENSSQAVHILTSTSITNEVGLISDSRSDLLFTPIKNINDVVITSENLESDGNNLLKVDKYLYLRLDKTHNNIFSKYINDDGEYKFINDNINDNLSILKYKLSLVVNGINSEILKNTLQYGKIYDSIDKKIVSLNTNNVVYPKGKEINDTIPESFSKILNTNDGYIYCWELTNDDNELFDVEGFDKNAYDSSNSLFRYIFTTTITPSIDSEIMWFNAAEIYELQNKTEDNKYIIPGWNYIGKSYHNVFDFIKFVPVYNKSDELKVAKDTALNINYNVNISGDTVNPYKNITVHGDITSNNISAESITSNEYHNIITNDDIIANKGIILKDKFSINDDKLNTDIPNITIKTNSLNIESKNDDKKNSTDLVAVDMPIHLYNNSDNTILVSNYTNTQFNENKQIKGKFNDVFNYYNSLKSNDKLNEYPYTRINGVSTITSETDVLYGKNETLDAEGNLIYTTSINFNSISAIDNTKNDDNIENNINNIKNRAIQSFTIPKYVYKDSSDGGGNENDTHVYGSENNPVILELYVTKGNVNPTAVIDNNIGIGFALVANDSNKNKYLILSNDLGEFEVKYNLTGFDLIKYGSDDALENTTTTNENINNRIYSKKITYNTTSNLFSTFVGDPNWVKFVDNTEKDPINSHRKNKGSIIGISIDKTNFTKADIHYKLELKTTGDNYYTPEDFTKSLANFKGTKNNLVTFANDCGITNKQEEIDKPLIPTGNSINDPIDLIFVLDKKVRYDEIKEDNKLYLNLVGKYYNQDDSGNYDSENYNYVQILSCDIENLKGSIWFNYASRNESFDIYEENISFDINRHGSLENPIDLDDGTLVADIYEIGYWGWLQPLSIDNKKYTTMQYGYVDENDGIYKYRYVRIHSEDSFESLDSITVDSYHNISAYINAYIYNLPKTDSPDPEVPETPIKLKYELADNDIKIDFKNTSFIFGINVNSKSINGIYPVLFKDTNNTSYMSLDLYYSYKDTSTNEDKFEYLDSVKKYNFNEYNFDWKGYNTEDVLDCDRTYHFEFLPKTITISKSKHERIWELINGKDGKDKEDRTNVTFYVVPTYKLDIEAKDKNYNLIKDVKIISAKTNVNTSDINSDNVIVKYDEDNKPLNTSYTSTGYIEYCYKLLDSTETIPGNTRTNEDKNNITTICNDGILFKVGNNIFGIGMKDNEPAIIYNDTTYWLRNLDQ